MCVFYTVRGHHFVASRVSSQTPAQLKTVREGVVTLSLHAQEGVAAGPSAPLVGPDPNMPSSVYRWSIFSIKLQTQKERHGVGERRANPETTLPSRPPGPLAAAGLPGGTPAGARLFYARFGVDNPPGPIFGSGPKGEQTAVPATAPHAPHEGDVCEDVFYRAAVCAWAWPLLSWNICYEFSPVFPPRSRGVPARSTWKKRLLSQTLPFAHAPFGYNNARPPRHRPVRLLRLGHGAPAHPQPIVRIAHPLRPEAVDANVSH